MDEEVLVDDDEPSFDDDDEEEELSFDADDEAPSDTEAALRLSVR